MVLTISEKFRLNVEGLNDARTKLAGLFSILLEDLIVFFPSLVFAPPIRIPV